jgi:hypothetical protein
MYHDLRQQFWWTRMKCEVARYVSKCDTCRKVKADMLLQPMSLPEFKFDTIGMDFIMGLPMKAHKLDSILVIMDRLPKSDHFIPFNTNYKAQKYA